MVIWRHGTPELAAKHKLIMKNDPREKLWIVVEVESGIAVDAKAYRNEVTAMRRLSSRRRRLNLHDDDIQMFQVAVSRRAIQ